MPMDNAKVSSRRALPALNLMVGLELKRMARAIAFEQWKQAIIRRRSGWFRRSAIVTATSEILCERVRQMGIRNWRSQHTGLRTMLRNTAQTAVDASPRPSGRNFQGEDRCAIAEFDLTVDSGLEKHLVGGANETRAIGSKKLSSKAGRTSKELWRWSSASTVERLNSRDVLSRAYRFSPTTPQPHADGKGAPGEKRRNFFVRDAIRVGSSAAPSLGLETRAPGSVQQDSTAQHQPCDWAMRRELRVAGAGRNRTRCPEELGIRKRANEHRPRRRFQRIASFLPRLFRDGEPSRQCARRVPATLERLLPRHSVRLQVRSALLTSSRRNQQRMRVVRERRERHNSHSGPLLLRRRVFWSAEAAGVEAHGFHQLLPERWDGLRRTPVVAPAVPLQQTLKSLQALRVLATAAEDPKFPVAFVQGPNEPSALQFPPQPIHPPAGGALFADSRWHSDDRVQTTPKMIATTKPCTPTADGQGP
jgi:hypothetical protein